MTHKRTTVILGAGAFGRALYTKICQASPTVPHIWRRPHAHGEPESDIPYGYDLYEALHNADTLIYALPAQVFRSFWAPLKTHLQPHIPLLITAKGLEQDTGFFFDDIMNDLALPNPLSILSGPHLAKELQNNGPTLGVISGSPEATTLFQQRLTSPTFLLSTHTNMRAAMLANAFKNVLALLGGVIRGEGGCQNTLNSFLGLGFQEMRLFAHHEDVADQDLLHPALLGDFMLTTQSLDSRNTKMGMAIGRGDRHNTSFLSEGMTTLTGLLVRAQKTSVRLPVCQALHTRIDGTSQNAEETHPLGSQLGALAKILDETSFNVQEKHL
ncbi:NAD(P)H-dependent glycerol-3-phosphate dehydrogenase [Candidatus Hepatobacter penaei]|uniref:NAD(P)H-dependent glycerol-3-phosphate dehydrogenase n=1 Tax=Candidatus Hepatobacter penaei TaxID=1274402 RepID=UPI0004F337EA|nr:NAD(P)H-dependent glycerol-3-phosphate dehydrogenase [Candidatus Hepatobacter penaei]